MFGECCRLHSRLARTHLAVSVRAACRAALELALPGDDVVRRTVRAHRDLRLGCLHKAGGGWGLV